MSIRCTSIPQLEERHVDMNYDAIDVAMDAIVESGITVKCNNIHTSKHIYYLNPVL